MIALHIPLWRRPEIESIVLDYYADMAAERGDMALYCSWSEETPRSLLEQAQARGWHVLDECPSAPLGAKLNAATTQMRGIECDLFCEIGSDDLIHGAALDALVEEARYYPAVGFGWCYVLDAITWRMARLVRPPAPHMRAAGVGRMLQREVMDTLGWVLRDDHAMVGLDGCLDSKLRQVLGVYWHLVDGPSFDAPAVDVKTGVNITTFESLSRYSVQMQPYPPFLVLRAFGLPMVERLALMALAIMPERMSEPERERAILGHAVDIARKEREAQERAAAMQPYSSMHSVRPEGTVVELRCDPRLRAKGFVAYGECPSHACVASADGHGIDDDHPCECIVKLINERRHKEQR